MKAQTNRNQDFILRLLQAKDSVENRENIAKSFFAANQFTRVDLEEIFKEENFPEDKFMVFNLVQDFLEAKDDIQIQDLFELIKISKINNIYICRICYRFLAYRKNLTKEDIVQLVELIDFPSWQDGRKEFLISLFSQAIPNVIDNFENIFNQFNFRGEYDESCGVAHEDEYITLFAYIILSGLDYQISADDFIDLWEKAIFYNTYIFDLEILKKFLIKNQVSVTDFIKIFSNKNIYRSQREDESGFEVIQHFLSTVRNITTQELVDILKIANFLTEKYLVLLIKDFLAKDDSSSLETNIKIIVDLAKSIPILKPQAMAKLIYDEIVEKKQVPELQDLVLAFGLVPVEEFKFCLISLYLEKSNQVNAEDVIAILREANFQDNPYRGIDILKLLRDQFVVNAEQFIKILAVIDVLLINADKHLHNYYKHDLIKEFLLKPSTSFEDFVNILISANLDVYDLNQLLTSRFSQNNISARDFISCISQVDFKDNNLLKDKLITAFVWTAKIDLEDFVNILISANLDGYDLNQLLTSRFSQNNISARDFISCISQVDFKDNNLLKDKLITVFSQTAKIDLVEDLIEIIKLAGADYSYVNRVKIYEDFIGKQTDQTLTYQAIKKIITSDDHLKYDVSTIVNLYRYVYFNLKYDVAQEFSEALSEIYPNIDFIRIELLQEAIDGGIINKKHINQLNLNQIEDDDLVLNFIEYATTRLQLNLPHILALIKDRCFARYDFIKEVVGEQRLANQCLSAQGIDFITGIFGAEVCASLKILEVISYFDIHKGLDQIASSFTAEFRQEITDNFKPSDKNLVVTKQEIEKLQQLTATENIDQEFLSVGDLCDYFVHKVATEPLENPENFQINFDNCAIFTTEKQEEINQNFRNLLTNRDITNVDVIRFFQDVLGDDRMLIGADGEVLISEQNQKMIFDLFEKSKSKFAHLFQQNGGIEEFAQCFGKLLFGLNDGCVNNIGSQFSVAFYQALLKNWSDAALFQVMQEDIIIPILNRGGDVIGVESDPLNNYQVKQNYLSPPALFKKITTKCFYNEDAEKKVVGEGAWEFIWDQISQYSAERVLDIEEFKEKFLGIIVEKYPDEIDQKAAQLATYILVCNTIGTDNVVAKSTLGLQAKEILDAVINELAPIQEAVSDQEAASDQESESNQEDESDQEIRSQGTLEEDLPDEEMRPESVRRIRGRRAKCNIM